jgi:hypothetical protein
MNEYNSSILDHDVVSAPPLESETIWALSRLNLGLRLIVGYDSPTNGSSLWEDVDKSGWTQGMRCMRRSRCVNRWHRPFTELPTLFKGKSLEPEAWHLLTGLERPCRNFSSFSLNDYDHHGVCFTEL